MNLKKIKMISIIGIFLLSFLTHQMYDWFPNKLFSIFFSVNESIWEHLKMIFTTYLIWGIAEKALLKNVSHDNFTFSLVSSALINIIIFSLIFIPILNLMEEHNLIITLIIYFVSIIISQVVSYFILNSNEKPLLNKLSFVLIPIIITMFGILTYRTPKLPIFYDEYSNKYGVYTEY